MIEALSGLAVLLGTVVVPFLIGVAIARYASYRGLE